MTPSCVRPALRLSHRTVGPGGTSRVSVTAPPGSVVVLRGYTRPSTTYRLLRHGTADTEGEVSWLLRPSGSTRLYAEQRGCTQTSDSAVLFVRPVVTLAAARLRGPVVRFSGRVLPARAGQLVSLTSGGTLLSQARTRPDGTWRVDRRLLGRLRGPVVAVVTGDMTLTGSRSGPVVVRQAG